MTQAVPASPAVEPGPTTITIERRWAFAGLAATGLVLLALIIALVVGDDDSRASEPGLGGPFGAMSSEGGPEGMAVPPPAGGPPEGGSEQGTVPPGMPVPPQGGMPQGPDGYRPQAPATPQGGQARGGQADGDPNGSGGTGN